MRGDNNPFILFPRRFLIRSSGSFLCLLVGSVLTVLAGNSPSGVRVLSSGEKKLVLEYSPVSPTFATLSVDSQTYVSLHIDDCGNLNGEGKPIAPVKALLVGVPPEAHVTARVVDIQYTELEGYHLVPAPKARTDEKGNVIEKTYRKDPEVYSRDNYFPPLSAEVSPPSWLRHQRIVSVSLFPVQWNPVSGRLRICKKMVVEIDFEYDAKLAKQGLMVSDPVFETFYASNLLNYEAARKWRVAVPQRIAKQSPTFSGSWYKMFVENDGIYKLEYATLAGMGFDSTALNAEQARIFYGGGRELPQQVTEKEPELKEVATYFHDTNGDGLLGKEDYLLFYGQGTSGWTDDSETRKYAHYINHYTDRNVYWLWIGSAGRKMMRQKDGGKFSYSAPEIVRTYRSRIFQEEERLNAEKSGIEWMWDRLHGTMYREYPIRTTHIAANDSVTLRVRVQGIAEYHHDVSFFLNGQLLQEIDLPYTLGRTVEMRSKGILMNGDNSLRISLQSPGGDQSEIYFDWQELEFWRYLQAENDRLWFSSSEKGGVLEYRLEGFSATAIALFDVSNPYDVVRIENAFVDSANVISFRDSVNSFPERHYFALSEAHYRLVSQLVPSRDPSS